MDSEEFRVRAKQMVDYVADYLNTVEGRRPLPQVQPGYLKDLIPAEAPEHPEQWKDVFEDVERVIMPGVTHWHSPHFHAYFPTASSYPAIIADILSAGIGCMGFTWASSPACAELEMITLDWLAKLLRLPDQFLSTGTGGGVIQNSASDSTFIALLAARSKALRHFKEQNPDLNENVLTSKLVCYGSDEAHCSVERASMLGGVICRKVASDDKESMCGAALRAAIQADREKGLIPFYCVATLGTTPTCAYDNLLEIGPVCAEEKMWLHIDAAYAGSALICPEFRPLLDGVEWADSFNFNAHKWLLVNFDCSTMWFKERRDIVATFNNDPLFLKVVQEHSMPDYRHWGITFGRRFRSLKLWFVLRLYGLSGLQAHIRKHVALAKEFQKLVASNKLFQLTHAVTLGLVCFRLKGENAVNSALLELINSDGRIHLVSAESKGVVFLRFVVCAATTELKDVLYAWRVVEELAASVLLLRGGNEQKEPSGPLREEEVHVSGVEVADS